MHPAIRQTLVNQLNENINNKLSSATATGILVLFDQVVQQVEEEEKKTAEQPQPTE